MRVRLVVILMLICTFTPFAAPQPVATAQGVTVATLVPLPRNCGGVLPPGLDAPACCLFGYVFIDGEAVAEARVRVTANGHTIEDWTGAGPDSNKPYYRLSLSDAPLNVSVGDQITIQIDYGNHQRIVNHVAIPGAQQVDVVLPQRYALDYAFDRQIWRQLPGGALSGPKDIAVDSQGTYYVLDSANARVQVFSSERRFLFQWGTMGNAYGQFIGTPTALTIGTNSHVYVADAGNNRVQEFTRNGSLVRSWRVWGPGNAQPLLHVAGIAADPSGDIFVTDWMAKAVVRFSGSGSYKTHWQVGGIDSTPRGIAIGPNGIVYVTDAGMHQIWTYTRDGIAQGGWGAKGSGPGQFLAPADIVAGADGSVYVVERDNYRVQKFDANGKWLRSWGQRGSAAGQFEHPGGVGIGANNQLLVVDSWNHRVQEFTGDGLFLRTWGQGSIAPEQFQNQSGIAIDKRDNLYSAEHDFGRVQKFGSDGTAIYTLAERGSGNRQFANPAAVAADQAGNLYVADSNNHRVQKLAPNGAFLQSWGSLGSGADQLNKPFGIVVGPDGMVYVADSGNNRVQVFTAAGVPVRRFGIGGDAPGEFDTPQDVAFDSAGNLYVLDKGNNRVQKLTATGSPITSWGSAGTGTNQFMNPQRLAVDSQDNIYVTDQDNERISRFTPAGTLTGWWGYAVGKTQFINPTGIAFDSAGNLYLGDQGNNRVQIWRPMTFTRPIATLVAISARSVVQGQPISLYGMGSDSDQTEALAALEWFLDGATSPTLSGASVSLPTAGLAPGRHTISLRARDTEGELSDVVATTFDVSSGIGKPPPRRWTFLLYLDGDAPNLAPYLNRTSSLGAINRLERAGPNALVTVAAIYDGPLAGGGDSFRYLIRPDGTLTQESLGEVNMGDPQTLIDFVEWGLGQAPVDATYLALADHASALDGIAWDLTTDRNERLTPAEIRNALVAITDGGARPIDVLHFDGCLMGLLESAYQVRGLARYLVASENLGWGSFAYEQYRALVTEQTDPATLAKAIADSYAMAVGSFGLPYTISTLDLGQVAGVAQATDALAGELVRYTLQSGGHSSALKQLRSQVQKFDSGANFELNNEDEYVDLDHWAELVAAQVPDSAVQAAAAKVRADLRAMVLRNHVGSGSLEAAGYAPGAGYELGHARGVGIYYPPLPSVKTYQEYIRGELTFALETRWSEYLATGLAALPFDPNDPAPQPVEPLPLPAAGNAPLTEVFLPQIRR